MGTPHHHIPNRLWITRIKRGLPRKQVAALLGQRSTSQLCRWEEGVQLPSLANALLLGYLLEMPVELLFKGLREALIAQARLRRQPEGRCWSRATTHAAECPQEDD
jgi:transcriptional regulator with XRE-family HTH domain